MACNWIDQWITTDTKFNIASANGSDLVNLSDDWQILNDERLF